MLTVIYYGGKSDFALNAKQIVKNLKARLPLNVRVVWTFCRWRKQIEYFISSYICVHLNIKTERRTETGVDIWELPHTTTTHTQTNNKSQSFSSDIQIKSKRPPEDCITAVVPAYDSFITVVWNADQARGTLLFTPKPLPTILSNKSFLALSRPVFFSSLCFWWLINTCTLHARLNDMSPRLLASSMHLVMRNWSHFVAFGYLLSDNIQSFIWQKFGQIVCNLTKPKVWVWLCCIYCLLIINFCLTVSVIGWICRVLYFDVVFLWQKFYLHSSL